MSRMNLIMTTVANYGFDDVSIFLKSVRKQCPDSILAIFHKTIKADLIDWCSGENNVQLISIEKSDSKLHIQSERYLHYLDYLLEHRNTYRAVFLTDARDVLFQGDPFVHLNEGDLILAAEDLKFESEAWNKSWLVDMYGHYIAQHLFEMIISCSGTTIGSTDAIIKYLVEMNREIMRNYNWNMLSGFDQGVHNYLRWRKKIPEHVFDVENRVFATVAMTRDFAISFDQGEIRKGGLKAPVVHQWDRHPELCGKIRHLFV